MKMAMQDGKPEPYPERKYYIFNKKNEKGKLDYKQPALQVVDAVRRRPGVFALLGVAVIGAAILGWRLMKKRRGGYIRRPL